MSGLSGLIHVWSTVSLTASVTVSRRPRDKRADARIYPHPTTDARRNLHEVLLEVQVLGFDVQPNAESDRPPADAAATCARREMRVRRLPRG